MPSLTQASPAAPRDLSFEQTVRRSLVHKRSLENVLLTEIRACADDRFVCGGRVPTAHRFFNDAGRTPEKDILFYTELGRQASLAISHAFLEVSHEEVFIFEQSEAVLMEEARRPASRRAPDSVVVEVRIREIARRKTAVSRVVAEHLMWIGDEPVFHGTGAWSVQPAALFQRLRRMSAARSAPALTEAAGATGGHRNVVIRPPEYVENTGGFRAALVVDPAHPYFFDHPCDHVPGMLLLEACAQLAKESFARRASVDPGTAAICGYEVNFVQFVECGVPTTLTAHVQAAPGPDGLPLPPAVDVSISQGDAIAGTATMTVLPG